MPSITIIIPCFNARAFIARAIESVRAQTLPDWEVLVVDDCSTDGSLEYLRELAEREPRIRVLSTAQNGGPSVARNLAIEHSRGDWIAILDADDAFRENRLETLTNSAVEAGADIIFDNLVYYDAAAGVETGIALPAMKPQARQPITLADLINGERPGSNLKLGFLKPLIRREFLIHHRLRYDDRIRLAEDFDLYARIILAGGVAWLCGAPLYIYTTQFGHVSRERSSATRTLYQPDIRVHIFDRLIKNHRGHIGDEQLQLLERGRRWQELYADAYSLGRFRREGNWTAFAKLAVKRPKALLRFATRSKYLRRLLVRQKTAAGI